MRASITYMSFGYRFFGYMAFDDIARHTRQDPAHHIIVVRANAPRDLLC
jgi:hypothetical protein